MFSQKQILKVLKWLGVGILGAFVLLVLWRIPYVIEQEKTVGVVAKIHATKLTIDDVMGKNLPPDPGAEADKTIAGIDANQNGIRDDVELAIFKKYPDSAKTRAALLQYALALQMELSQPLNTEVASVVAEKESVADGCVADTLVPRTRTDGSRSYTDVQKIYEFIDFVEGKQFNDQKRLDLHDIFFDKIGSYSSGSVCDIEMSGI